MKLIRAILRMSLATFGPEFGGKCCNPGGSACTCNPGCTCTCGGCGRN